MLGKASKVSRGGSPGFFVDEGGRSCTWSFGECTQGSLGVLVRCMGCPLARITTDNPTTVYGVEF